MDKIKVNTIVKSRKYFSGILFSFSLASLNLSADEIHDWNGLYGGGLIGYSNTTIDQRSGGSQFHGDVYNSINSINFSNPTPGSSLSKSFDLPLFPNLLKSDDSKTIQGTFLIGKNIQDDHIVFGGEFRSSFGDFGNSSSTSSQGSGSVTGHDYEGIPNQLQITNFNNVITGLPISTSNHDISATFQQQLTQINEVKFENINSLIGRVGYAKSSLLLYVLGGINLANINAKTQSTITESVTGSVTPRLGGSAQSFSGSQTYLLSGEHNKNMIGYSIGAGLDWAIDDKLTLRVEGEYRDLGSINVNGSSSQTVTSYTIKQDITAYALSTGLIYRF